MISKELDGVDPFVIKPNLGKKRNLMSSELRRLEKHLFSSKAVPNYPQVIDSLAAMEEELEFVKSLIRTFQSRIP